MRRDLRALCNRPHTAAHGLRCYTCRKFGLRNREVLHLLGVQNMVTFFKQSRPGAFRPPPQQPAPTPQTKAGKGNIPSIAPQPLVRATVDSRPLTPGLPTEAHTASQPYTQTQDTVPQTPTSQKWATEPHDSQMAMSKTSVRQDRAQPAGSEKSDPVPKHTLAQLAVGPVGKKINAQDTPRYSSGCSAYGWEA